MKEKPLVSVIVPTYKRPSKLKRALDSINSQTYENIEIIVVDDNNENDRFRRETIEFIKKYRTDKKIQYIKHKNNKGGALARNTGIKNAEGEFITFLDDDDEYLPEKVEKQYNKYINSAYTNLGLVYCQINFMDSKGNYRKMRAKTYASGNTEALKKHMIRNLSPTSGLFLRKKIFDKVGLFKDLLTGHEYELILRILIKGFNVDYNKEAMVNMYYHTEGRLSNSDKKIQGEKDLFRIKMKYFNLVGNEIEKKVKYKHYLDMTKRYLMQNKKKEAKKYLNKAFHQDNFKIKTLINYTGILIDKFKSRWV
ncbi:MAG: glycosyltransferase family 2 protein [Candidatus Mcinerneyibacterium aminivorans]|uniref:Glycosyltransferase family 2 protein n=1 Tax=Candidatus Mcinerneyibacterium aminivorans TaxID=2703815 RepID=A0A5D0MBS1_9BACT|nr:MAG: glycosyltransferase family 2 protein [Candidatus Mcinerneyibacterium aminivorans]